MTQFVVIRDMSAGNESVGEMWQETKIFDGSATLEEVMLWAEGNNYSKQLTAHSRKRITITRPEEQ